MNTDATPTVVANPEISTEPGPSATPDSSTPTNKPDLKAEGAYITVTNRGNQNSGPIQYLGDKLKASGDGTYYLSAWVKIPENSADKKVGIIVYCKFGTENKYVYPTVTKTISNGEWTLVAGEIEIKNTAGCTANNDSYFRIQTGSAATDNWDVWFDGMTLNKKNADGSYGKNILANGDCSIDDPATWANTTTCKVTFVGVAKQQPTGVIITATEDTETNHIITNTGVVSKNDIKDGKITKTYTILNEGKEAVKVTFSLQVAHKKADGSDMWSTPAKGFTALIEPGESQELTFTMDVNEDGKITVTGGDNEASYEPEKFFARFDILEADGNPKVLKGTKLVILNNNPDISFTAGDKNVVKVEVTYSKQYATSDMIPISAFVLMPVIVAFAVVIKKRKEN
ncbi:MAG: hypothetical protein E7365_05315 [Clostridiales bacterium]|nr:hypothetical protein [Clostridiales bacterium]